MSARVNIKEEVRGESLCRLLFAVLDEPDEDSETKNSESEQETGRAAVRDGGCGGGEDSKCEGGHKGGSSRRKSVRCGLFSTALDELGHEAER